MASLIFTLVFLLMTGVAQAATYYVATDGSNSNNGTSEDTPFLTVAHAVTTMVAGDTTYVRSGTYIEPGVLFRRTGTQAAQIKLLNYPGEAPVFQCVSSTAQPSQRIQVHHANGQNVPIGWITIEGFEITNCSIGIQVFSSHDITIRRNWIHDNRGQGILGPGIRFLIDRNIIEHNGDFAACAIPSTAWKCNQSHGIYMSGGSNVVTNNLIIDTLAYGIHMAGAYAFDAAQYATAEYVTPANWIIANNTFAYQNYRAAIGIWGGKADNTRVENNIFYENAQEISTGSPQGIDFISNGGASGSTGNLFRNNLSYASGSGGTVFISSVGIQGVNYTQSGNVVGNPLFVTGGTNSLPVSWDFTLTSTSPAIGIARVNEYPRNASLTAGAFDTVGSPMASITANKITITFPMSNAVPLKGLTTTGVTVSCTANVCPGTDIVSTVTNPSGTDAQAEITLSGITGNACVAHADAVTTSYNSATGSWTGNDNIGPYPGIHQKIFSHTNLTVTNQCTGSGPSTEPGTPHIHYKFDEGAGTTAQDETANNLDCTFTNTPTWGVGKTGTAMVTANASSQYCAVPWGNGINPSTQDMTWSVGVFVPSGTESAQRFIMGPNLGTDQRGYVASDAGTWKVSVQSVAINNVPASNLAVTAGWNFITAVWNATTDTVTLYKDGVAGNGGAVRTYTSYTFASNLRIGLIGTNTAKSSSYDEFTVYLSLEDPAELFAAFQASEPPPATGTLTQKAIRFQAVHLGVDGNPEDLGSNNIARNVIKNGAVAVIIQVDCENIADCDQTGFRLVYAKDGSGVYMQVPNEEGSDGIRMWGVTTHTNLNTGNPDTRLTGSCAVTTGATQLNKDQVPSIDLPQNGCTVLRYIVRVGDVTGSYFTLRLLTENGVALTGGYTADARINVIPSQATVGF